MIKSYVRQLWSILRHDPLLLALLVSATAYFILYYITDPTRQSGTFHVLGFKDMGAYPQGWFGYYDQGQYLRLAHTLASFNFSELHTTYSYGVGYPLVAVPLIWLGVDSDPFVLFNLIAFVFATYAVYKVAKHVISPLAGFLAGSGLVFASPLIHYVDQPWNSTVCLVAMSGILITLTIKRITRWHALVLGLLLGWAFAARYVDIFFLGPLALAALYRGSYKVLANYLLAIAIGVSIFAVPVMYSQYKIFGSPFRTPYVNHLGINGADGSDQGLKAYNIERVPQASLALFVSPRLAGSTDGDRGLFIDMFWALAAIPGAFVLLRCANYRLFFGTFLSVLFVACIFYLSFRASTAGSLKYGELHYFKMFWPGLIIFAVAYLDRLIKPIIAPATPAAAQPARAIVREKPIVLGKKPVAKRVI